MPKITNIGPDEVEIAHAGSLYGPVAPGESIEVPDDAYDGLVIQTDKWAPAAPAKKTTTTRKDEA